MAVSVAISLVLYGVGELPEPGPVTKILRSRERGLTERETLDYLTMSNELKKMKEEEIEDARKKAKRQSRNR